MQKQIRVKIIKENASTVTLRMLSLNRNMPVKKKEFEQRVKNGLYDVVNQADYENLFEVNS